jgi:acyl-CoA thioester hydrolase
MDIQNRNMTTIETLRGFVNAWDCDENDHLNVKFYFHFFEDAAAHFLALAGIAPPDRPTPLTRHVRFHSELRSGQLVRAESHAAQAATGGGWHLVHRLSEPATGRLAATALDTYESRPPAGLSAAIPEEAGPRSLAAEPADIAALDARRPTVTHRGRLDAWETGPGGHPYHRALVARISDAAAHFWERFGASEPWLAEHGYGRAALEMKLTRGAPCKAGLVELRSGPLAAGGKTVSFFHLVRATDGGATIAAAEVTALLFDRARRKAVDLPDVVREKIAAELDR